MGPLPVYLQMMSRVLLPALMDTGTTVPRRSDRD